MFQCESIKSVFYKEYFKTIKRKDKTLILWKVVKDSDVSIYFVDGLQLKIKL